jgi:hypothetical protein
VELIVAATRTTPMEPPVAAAARVLVSAAAELVTGVQRAVIGPGNVRTARDNAWDAMLADRARNEARAELTREVAALVAAGRHPAATRAPARAFAKSN